MTGRAVGVLPRRSSSRSGWTCRPCTASTRADSFIPVFAGLYRWTPFFWEQNRFGQLIPLLSLPIDSPFANLLFQVGLRLFAVAAAFFLLARTVVPRPLLAGGGRAHARALDRGQGDRGPRLHADAALRPGGGAEPGRACSCWRVGVDGDARPASGCSCWASGSRSRPCSGSSPWSGWRAARTAPGALRRWRSRLRSAACSFSRFVGLPALHLVLAADPVGLAARLADAGGEVGGLSFACPWCWPRSGC